MLTFIVQLAASAFTVRCFISRDFTIFPAIAIAFLVCDLLGVFTGKLKTLNIPLATAFCVGMSIWLRAVNIYTIAAGYATMQTAMTALSVVMMAAVAVGSLISAISRR